MATMEHPQDVTFLSGNNNIIAWLPIPQRLVRGRRKLHLMQYLSKGIRQRHGKEEVCVGTPSVDPEVPEDRAESRGEEEHHQYHQSVAQVYM